MQRGDEAVQHRLERRHDGHPTGPHADPQPEHRGVTKRIVLAGDSGDGTSPPARRIVRATPRCLGPPARHHRRFIPMLEGDGRAGNLAVVMRKCRACRMRGYVVGPLEHDAFAGQ